MPSGVYPRKSAKSDQPTTTQTTDPTTLPVRRVVISEMTYTYLTGLSDVMGLTGSQIVEMVLQDKEKIKEQLRKLLLDKLDNL